MTTPAGRPYLWMLCGSFAFTLMAELAHVLTRECDWQTVAVFRSGLVTLFALAIALAAGARLVFWPWRLWVRSVAGSGSMVCTFYAFWRLPAADVVTLTNTFPIWVAVLSWPLYRQAPGGRLVLAILVGILGVALVEQPHLEAGNLGVLTALAAAFWTAVAMLGLHSLKHLDPRAVVVHFSAVATVFCTAALLLLPRSPGPGVLTDPWVLARLVAMGVCATAGQLCLTKAFGGGHPGLVSVVGLTQIVFALGFDAWLFGRTLDAVTLAGTVLVILPTAWVLLRSRKKVRVVTVLVEPPATPSPNQLADRLPSLRP